MLAGSAAFLAGIDGALPFATPVIEEIAGDGTWTIERRLPGRSMLSLLPDLHGMDRDAALASYAGGAEAPGRVALPDRAYGQILADDAIVAATWRDYLRLSLDRFLAWNGKAIGAALGDVEGLRAAALALLGDVPELPPKVLVHGDYFPGNVLLDDRLRLSGLVDFSVWTVTGDRVLDLAGAAIFLEMADGATADDVAGVRALILSRHGGEVTQAGRFYRAYSAFAIADPTNSGGLYPRLFPWALANLTALRAGTIAF